ncbi:tetratricopeptide repeat-containing sensor histidine kinase [Pedobacter jamesrossensis]|uniref:histidine kinase n=1 Tax=Pedobacter jamesrossensis TaxID=1908238 RepID=A0ABV8NJV9_9SPHI
MVHNRTIIILLSILLWSCKPPLKNNPDNKLAVDKIIDEATNLYDLEQPDKANSFLHSSFNTLKNPGIGDLWQKYNLKGKRIFLALRIKNDTAGLAKAKIYADSMFNIIKDNKVEERYNKQLYSSYIFKGDIELEYEAYYQAYKYFYSGKILADKTLTDCDKSDFYNRFAALCFLQGKFKQAAHLYLEAYRGKQKCETNFKNYQEIQGALDNAGLSYQNIKMTDSAFICYQKALKFIDENAYRFPSKKNFIREARGVVFHNIGDIYLDSGKNEQAEFYFNKSIENNGSVGIEKRNAQVAQLKLARLYLNLGELKKTKVLIDKSRIQIDSIPNERCELLWLKLNIDYLNFTHQYAESSRYLNSFLTLQQKINNKERKLNEADANNEFFNLKKDYELSLLTKENQLNSLYLILAVGFSVMASFILYQMWKNFKTSKKTNIPLTLLNKQVNEQNLNLQDTLNALEQSQEENKRVMKVVAHDLRSPIGAIVSLAGFMMEDEKLQTEELQMISLIKSSGSDSLKFVNELLNRESTVRELDKELVDLNTLLTYCVNLLQYKADEKKQKIILKSRSISFNLNREKIWRVVSNLITNAIKFSYPESEINVNLDIEIDKVLITVTDKGMGIPNEMISTIFTISEDIKRAGTEGEKSFGMGLVISKQIVEAHGGKLWVESIPSNGTTFYVELPIV